ncbi:uncharacterized protein K460DRAFT_410925 [Cucurbitaria berberidis CBS 394.84]|uniref:Uncharacterized protein n=1 Tax=Cucurbitaria berberidis CBS 394.84 TaxID=1168544 RepID=A0A9P4G787_9PLEO|nr:uncharacterized protein K460DRAFT_410925 [Cucurbitaria berberidis CBS 394.84]KAF1840331.1 hypothetical protein K460DRAFT_410925 [Cucurbitaria berberidis CBS 394.84]
MISRPTIAPNTQFHVLSTLLLLTLASPATSLVLQNITIALPAGSSDHGTPGLLCTPAKPFDLLTFYLLNYVAHAATVVTQPGERADDYVAGVIGSLLFAPLGLYRGIEAILCGAVFVKKDDDLRKAARSGALCCVVRGADWRPVDGDAVTNVVLKRAVPDATTVSRGEKEDGQTKEKDIHVIVYPPPYMCTRFGCPVYVHRRIVHGTHSLPPGYLFVIVPHDAQFTSSSPSASADPPTIEVSATYNVVKALIALAQSGYALSTLYRSRGDQIRQFGYAAFGLTVAPYAVMSIMNLMGNLCRPEYPSLYMIESSIMDEARKRGGIFSGAVGQVDEDKHVAESICACHIADGEDVEDLRFSSNEAGSVEAHFSTIDPFQYTLHAEKQKNENGALELEHTASTVETKISAVSQSANLSMIRHTQALAPIPLKLNYINTRNDALLLIPNHTSIVRCTPSPSPKNPPLQHFISAIKLKRTFLFLKDVSWTLTFPSSASSTHARRWWWIKYTLTTFTALLPLVLTGTLSKFKPGSIPAEETMTWRIYTVQWLCLGVVTGLSWVVGQEGKDSMPSLRVQVGPWARIVGYVVTAGPAVGGYIVVGQMLYRYGSCVWIGD